MIKKISQKQIPVPKNAVNILFLALFDSAYLFAMMAEFA